MATHDFSTQSLYTEPDGFTHLGDGVAMVHDNGSNVALQTFMSTSDTDPLDWYWSRYVYDTPDDDNIHTVEAEVLFFDTDDSIVLWVQGQSNMSTYHGVRFEANGQAFHIQEGGGGAISWTPIIGTPFRLRMEITSDDGSVSTARVTVDDVEVFNGSLGSTRSGTYGGFQLSGACRMFKFGFPNGIEDAPPVEPVAFTDDFNRSDSTDFGANWTELADGDGAIVSGQAVIPTGSGESCLAYTTPANTAKQFSQHTVTADWTSDTSRGPFIASDLSADNAGYMVNWRALDNRWRIWRNSVNVNNVNGGPDIVAGDVIRIESEPSGANLIVRTYHNGNLVNEYTDTSPLTGQYVGFNLRTGQVSADDWSGGDVDAEEPSAPTTAITGTGAVIRLVGGEGVVTAQANVSGSGAAVHMLAGTGAVAGSAHITGEPSSIEMLAGDGAVTAHAALEGGLGLVRLLAGDGEIGVVTDIVGTGGLLRLVAGDGEIGAATAITGAGGLVQPLAGEGEIDTATVITGTGGLIPVLGGVGAVSAAARIEGTGGLIEMFAGVADISTAIIVSGTGGVLRMVGGAGTIGAEAEIVGVPARIRMLTAEAPVSTSTLLAGFGGLIRPLAGPADIVGHAALDGEPGRILMLAEVGPIEATLIPHIAGTGGVIRLLTETGELIAATHIDGAPGRILMLAGTGTFLTTEWGLFAGRRAISARRNGRRIVAMRLNQRDVLTPSP